MPPPFFTDFPASLLDRSGWLAQPRALARHAAVLPCTTEVLVSAFRAEARRGVTDETRRRRCAVSTDLENRAHLAPWRGLRSLFRGFGADLLSGLCLESIPSGSEASLHIEVTSNMSCPNRSESPSGMRRQATDQVGRRERAECRSDGCGLRFMSLSCTAAPNSTKATGTMARRSSGMNYRKRSRQRRASRWPGSPRWASEPSWSAWRRSTAP